MNPPLTCFGRAMVSITIAIMIAIEDLIRIYQTLTGKNVEDAFPVL